MVARRRLSAHEIPGAGADVSPACHPLQHPRTPQLFGRPASSPRDRAAGLFHPPAAAAVSARRFVGVPLQGNSCTLTGKLLYPCRETLTKRRVETTEPGFETTKAGRKPKLSALHKAGCGSEKKLKRLSFFISFLSPCTAFVFRSSLALHYFASRRQAAARHEKRKSSGFSFCPALALHFFG